MQTVKVKERIPFPSGELSENFSFSCITESGTFTFLFKWFNNRWNLWVTLPDNSVRQAGVIPGVTSWSECQDFGLVFETVLETIDYNSLFLTEMYLLTWE